MNAIVFGERRGRKQKTAYEISECDWSSDVCSSDLSDQDAKENHFTLEKTELSDFNSLNAVSYTHLDVYKRQR